MNSVFSAFKSSKSDGNIPASKVKKSGPSNSSSYANLRHIREIGSSAKMSSFVGNNDDDSIAPNLRLTKCTATATATAAATTTLHSATVATTSTPSSSQSQSTSSIEQIIPQSASKINPHQNNNDCDSSRRNIQSESSHVNIDKNMIATTANDRNTGSHVSIEQSISSTSPSTATATATATVAPTTLHPAQSIAGYSNNIPSNGAPLTTDGGGVDHHSSRDSENKENTDTTNPSTKTSADSACLSDSSNVLNGMDNATKPIHSNDGTQKAIGNEIQPILSAASNKKLNRHSESTVPATSIKSAGNRFCKRLSLSGISSNPLPSVHGRTTSNGSNGNCGSGETKRTRISTHQRNLSLDFR